MRFITVVVTFLTLVASAFAQDQQLGARTKAMGGSYTAFEDDPVSVWLNPAGIATQPDSLSVQYQSYTTYPLHREKPPGTTTVIVSSEAESALVDPGVMPSYIGFVFQLGDPESPLALGICYAQPYHLNYSFDQVADPFQTKFTPDSNIDQSFERFRLAIAKDFRFQDPGTPGTFTHLSVGLGLDLGYERWEFKSTFASDATDSDIAYGYGAGLLLGVYDNTESLRVNFGVAYQSAIQWDFNIDPDIFPAFDMPQQINAGVSFYLFEGMPLRATVDFQWIEWGETADDPLYAGKESFEDAVNISLGFEYRVRLSDSLYLYPRAGIRQFDAPWSDEDDLPMTGDYRLVLDTDDDAFTIFTFGAGIAWSTEAGKSRSVDFAIDVGGDAPNFAAGLNFEF